MLLLVTFTTASTMRLLLRRLLRIRKEQKALFVLTVTVAILAYFRFSIHPVEYAVVSLTTATASSTTTTTPKTSQHNDLATASQHDDPLFCETRRHVIPYMPQIDDDLRPWQRQQTTSRRGGSAVGGGGISQWLLEQTARVYRNQSAVKMGHMFHIRNNQIYASFATEDEQQQVVTTRTRTSSERTIESHAASTQSMQLHCTVTGPGRILDIWRWHANTTS
jgi:hypothetical protein